MSARTWTPVSPRRKREAVSDALRAYVRADGAYLGMAHDLNEGSEEKSAFVRHS